MAAPTTHREPLRTLPKQTGSGPPLLPLTRQDAASTRIAHARQALGPGATWTGVSTTFRLWSSAAAQVTVVTWDEDALRETAMAPAGDGWWQVDLPGLGPGTRYGYRVDGPAGPGHRFQPERLLCDPYALGAEPDGMGGLVGVVVDESERTRAYPRPARPWADTVIYEAHVAGLTLAHPGVPAELRGTYLGACHPAVLAHLHRLGVTAIELLPVAAFADEPHLRAGGRHNYWGYNPVAFAAPHVGYSAGGTAQAARDEFRAMVAAFHAAGIEVILDVVFNHTGEGRPDAPALSLRGIDNAAYYLHSDDDPDRTVDITGCGNTLDVRHPATVELIRRSLHRWVEDYGVDGFRFDLATTLGRTGAHADFDPDAPLLRELPADPVLAGIKLIAEPWDLAGYSVGRFPTGWAQWNDRFRDDVRDYWRGAADRAAFATRLAGSADLFTEPGAPTSLHFVTAHDGFTLADLVSYERKHNDDNGEGNRDGADHNRSWNCGVEGPTDRPEVRELRRRQTRNLLATLILSRGVPMLLAGDEGGRTQNGNNNGYSAVDPAPWALRWADFDEDLVEFCAAAVRVRRRAPILSGAGRLRPDQVTWAGPDGRPPDEWHHGGPLAMILHERDTDLAIVSNPTGEPVRFDLPGPWMVLLDSADQPPAGRRADHELTVAAHGILVAGRRRPVTRLGYGTNLAFSAGHHLTIAAPRRSEENGVSAAGFGGIATGPDRPG